MTATPLYWLDEDDIGLAEVIAKLLGRPGSLELRARVEAAVRVAQRDILVYLHFYLRAERHLDLHRLELATGHLDRPVLLIHLHFDSEGATARQIDRTVDLASGRLCYREVGVGVRRHRMTALVFTAVTLPGNDLRVMAGHADAHGISIQNIRAATLHACLGEARRQTQTVNLFFRWGDDRYPRSRLYNELIWRPALVSAGLARTHHG